MLNEPTRPIRVMRIIARLNIGGPAIHVTLLTQQLSAPAFATMLVSGSLEPGEGDMQYYAAEHGVEPVIVPELRREIHLGSDIRALRRIYRLMRDYQPDVVHTHSAKAGFIGRLAAWLAGVPVIVHTFHGHVFKGYFSPAKTRLFILMEQVAARFSDTIITLTDSLRRELAEVYHITRKSRITVLPLGLDLAPFATARRKTGVFRRKHGLSEAAPLVGIVARITAVKNHSLFLQAAKHVHDTAPEVRFVIVGDGELRQAVEQQIIALQLTDVVYITGWERETVPVYADLDALVISSHNEGTPVTIIEALSAGCPVVGTRVGGMADLLEGGKWGNLVPPGDPEALANAILEVLRTPPDPAPAQQTMLVQYGIERLVKDIEGLYRGLLARKGVDLSRPPDAGAS